MSYRETLQSEYRQRANKNPRYSLRSFSRTLDVSHSFLSQVMTGKRHLSTEMALKVSRQLKLTAKSQREFCDQVQAEATRDEALRSFIETRIPKRTTRAVRNLAREEFNMIADWYHFAILELGKCKDVVLTPEHAAARFALPVKTMELAFGRLEALGFLRANGEHWLLAPEGTESYGTNSNISKAERSSAIKRFHRSQLDLARTAILQQDLPERDFSGMTLAIHPSQIPVVKEKIAALMREIESLTCDEKPTEVYHLATQFYRLGVPEEPSAREES